jgi:hypothetical protein
MAASAQSRGLMSRAIYLVPLAFALGIGLKEWRDNQAVRAGGEGRAVARERRRRRLRGAEPPVGWAA